MAARIGGLPVVESAAIFVRMPSLLARSSGSVAALIFLATGCDDSPTGPRTPLLARYVALGNSITAGFQSAGISDATQRAAYPALIARQAGVPYAFASLGAGCPPPITSLLSGLSGGGGEECSVAGRPGNKLLTNVAVPGADSFDPLATTPDPGDLTRLILDGMNQLEKALEQPPTFATVWIGNNDLLAAAIDGIVSDATVTPAATFTANYDEMIDALVEGGLTSGVLIGVADVTAIPLLVPASALADPSVRAALDFATNANVSVDEDCPASTVLISLAIVAAIASDEQEPRIACTVVATGGLGDRYVLDPTERATIQDAIAAYNTHIAQVAAAAALAYYDPNQLFTAARMAGEIPTVPSVFSSTPFGPLFSLDGVHPSSTAHARIANELIDAINDRYDTGIPRIAGSG
jgi:lysophospholipase L1-like esterase